MELRLCALNIEGKSLFCIVIKLKPVFEFVTFPLACLSQPPIFVIGSKFFFFVCFFLVRV